VEGISKAGEGDAHDFMRCYLANIGNA